jgi:hypothetical protein
MLPESEKEFLNSLGPLIPNRLLALHEAGWSLKELGDSLTPPRPKSTIYNWIKQENTGYTDEKHPVPLPTPSLPVRPISPKVPPKLVPELKRLAHLAQRCRAKTPQSSPFRIANDDLTQLATELYLKGVPVQKIAKACEVSPRAMFRRVSRGLSTL